MNKERILNNIDVSDCGCWVWGKSTSSAGYGQLTENKKYWLSHRYAFCVFVGDIPEGSLVRHICHNKTCCNPEHLALGSNKDNYRDSADVHMRANRKKAKKWMVNGVCYKSHMDVRVKTGLSSSTVTKYTKGGVFDVDGYRKGCKRANVHPKF